MALNFPANPTEGQEFTSPTGIVWVYQGGMWVLAASTGGGVLIGDPANPPVGMAVGQQLYGPGGPTVVLTGWLFRASGTPTLGQVVGSGAIGATSSIVFASRTPTNEISSQVLGELALDGDIITLTFDTGYVSHRAYNMGSNWDAEDGLSRPIVSVDPASNQGTLSTWPSVVDTPVTITVTPNPTEYALWVMTETGLVRAAPRVAAPPATLTARTSGGTAVKTGSNSAGAIMSWSNVTTFGSSDLDVFTAFDTRVRILRPGTYAIRISGDWLLGGTGVAPTPSRNAILALGLFRVPVGDEIGGVTQTSMVVSNTGANQFRQSAYTETVVTLTAPCDIFFRASENTGLADNYTLTATVSITQVPYRSG